MLHKVCFLDASLLRINDGAPVKVTFLNAQHAGHFVGFYSVADGVFQDVRVLFPNAGGESLIPGVSSVFLGSRLNGRTPVFFVIENGYSLNKDAFWFQDAIAGHSGFWHFLKPASQEGLVPALNQGKIVWQHAGGDAVEPAQPADLGTACPVLVWQSNGGQVFVVKGQIFHSLGSGVHAALNPDQHCRFLVAPQEDKASVTLNFIETAAQKAELAFSLQIGERNVSSLTRNRVTAAVSEWPQIQTPVLSAIVEIPEDFEDTLYLDGFENQTTLPIGGIVFSVEGSHTNKLIIKGKSDLNLYEGLLSCVKIRTEASAAAKSDVRIVLQTEKEESVIHGQADILSEKAQVSSVLSGLPLSKNAAEGTGHFPAGLFDDILPARSENAPSDELPSFLTQPVVPQAVVKAPSNGKTVLISGGACKRGSAAAHAFAARGYNVIIHCHTAAAQATHLVEELRQLYHVKTAYFRADFVSFEETTDLIPAVTKTYGPIDVLVCLASAFVKEETAQGWETNMAVNLRAPFLLTRAFAHDLPKGREGTVIAVFSEPPKELSSYALANTALPELMLLAADSCRDKVRVNGLAVGGALSEEAQNKKIAEMVCFLAENPIVSGQTVKIEAAGLSEKKTSLF
ncbi:MAG: SDR family NAD(P)-dependent oxidoreductase [Alphaproteobacteria bacterium]|nr:SDR family NAD(P)-dependent oxidoreductase [Alphaproteobacteria bacterium]